MPDVLWVDYAYPGGVLDGFAGVVRYLQTNNGSSRSRYDLTRAEVDMHHAAGRDVAAFWQDGASSAGLGFDRGASDARRADAAADVIGAPFDWPIHFAVDDPTLSGARVEPYFRGVMSAARRPVGGYGSADVCDFLAGIGVGPLIQTTSWSAGRVSSHPWLLQRDHNVISGTSKIDVDLLLKPSPRAWRPLMKATIYPPADAKTQWFAGAFPGSIMSLAAPVYVGHTTEGGYGWPGYQGGATAPTLTALPILAEKRLAWRQHFPINMSARALRNLSGGVQTNTAGAIQVELCGTCARGGPGMYWPEAPDWAIAGVADFVAFLQREWGLPLRLPPRGFRPYEDLMRGIDSQRMTFDEWVNFSGCCEHQNVPENDHGDASGVTARVVARLQSGNPPPVGEEDMGHVDTISDAAAQKIAYQLLTYDVAWVDPVTKEVSPPAHPKTSLGLTLGWIEEYTRRWAQEAKDQIIAAVVAAVNAAADDVDETAIREQVDAKLEELFADGFSAKITGGDLDFTPVEPPAAPESAPAEPPADAPDLDKSAPSPQEDTPGHDGAVPHS